MPSHAPIPLATFQDRVLALTNEIRANLNVPILTVNSKLIRAARMQANHMASTNTITHVGPPGYPKLRDRLLAYNYQRRLAKENAAAGQETPEWVVNSLMASSGHKAAIECPICTEIGIYAVRAASGIVYWCMVFADPMPKSKRTAAKHIPHRNRYCHCSRKRRAHNCK